MRQIRVRRRDENAFSKENSPLHPLHHFLLAVLIHIPRVLESQRFVQPHRRNIRLMARQHNAPESPNGFVAI